MYINFVSLILLVEWHTPYKNDDLSCLKFHILINQLFPRILISGNIGEKMTKVSYMSNWLLYNPKKQIFKGTPHQQLTFCWSYDMQCKIIRRINWNKSIVKLFDTYFFFLFICLLWRDICPYLGHIAKILYIL